jgi:predicted permease
MLGGVLGDLRIAFRLLRKDRGLTTALLLCISLGIGCTTAIFTLISAVFFRSLPQVAQLDRILALYQSRDGNPVGSVSYPDFLAYREANQVFSGLTAYRRIPLNLSAGGEAERTSGALVAENFFAVLGLKPARGRFFLEEEPHPVAVLSYPLWQQRFAATPHLARIRLVLNGHPFTVVGIAPPGFRGTGLGEATEIWVPIRMQPWVMPSPIDVLHDQRTTWFFPLGRLKNGVSFKQARVEMDVLARRQAQNHPENHRRTGVALMAPGMPPWSQHIALGVLGLLSVLAGLVLTLACANAAGLLLARAVARREEIGARLILGASRGRIVQQLLTESVAIALLAGGLGLALSFAATRGLASFIPKTDLPLAFDFTPDLRILGFALGASLLTGIAFGLAPAILASRPDRAILLAASGTTTPNPGKLRLLRGLVVLQLSLSLVLLLLSALFARSLLNLRNAAPGPGMKQILITAVDLQENDSAQGRQFYRHLLDRMHAIPGVRGASLAAVPPAEEGLRGGISAEDSDKLDASSWMVSYNVVSPGYFEFLGLPLVRGRSLQEEDREEAPAVAVLDQAWAARLWPGKDPLGRRLRFTSGEGSSRLVEIVGIVQGDAQGPHHPDLFLSFGQVYRPLMRLHLRYTTSATRALVERVQQEVRILDPDLPLFEIQTLADSLEQTRWRPRLISQFTGLLGIAGLVMAAIGLYGVMSHTLGQRKREIGIRMALGARPRDIYLLVARQGQLLTLTGIALGLGAVLAASKLLSRFLVGISPFDPLAVAIASLGLAAVALFATLWPTSSAARADPATLITGNKRSHV